MPSTSGSSEMSLRKFDGSNFNFWKEKIQDYLIVKAQIDLIETERMAEAGQNHPSHDSDALVAVGVLHSVIVFECFRIMEDILRQL